MSRLSPGSVTCPMRPSCSRLFFRSWLPLLFLRFSRQLAALTAVVWGVLTAACSNTPPVPDWQINARDATQRGTVAYLEGRSRVADAEFARARREATRSARADAVARVELARCAAQAAALAFSPCDAVAPLQADMGLSQQAYQRYLAGRPLASDVPALPVAQQPVAQWLLALPPGVAGTRRAAESGSELERLNTGSVHVQKTLSPSAAAQSGADPSPLLSPMADPLSRLVAAAVLVQAGHGSPAVVAAGVQAASDQGWTRPLLAWLGWQLRQAQAAGDAELARRTQGRIDLLANEKYK
jgi:hypothetical protein